MLIREAKSLICKEIEIGAVDRVDFSNFELKSHGTEFKKLSKSVVELFKCIFSKDDGNISVRDECYEECLSNSAHRDVCTHNYKIRRKVCDNLALDALFNRAPSLSLFILSFSPLFGAKTDRDPGAIAQLQITRLLADVGCRKL